MSLTKHASLEHPEILDVKGSTTRRIASLDKLSEFENFRTEDGYLYARIRAISSRVNKNWDGWPSIELAGGPDIFNRVAGIKTGHVVLAADKEAKFGYSTFVGKPIFVDHHNSNPKEARGVIVDSKLHVEDDGDPYYKTAADNHKPPTWVELLLEVDAKSFPKLATALIEGSQDPSKGIDGFSMGCDVRYSKCSHCGNKASSPDQYCEHVRLKGAEFPLHNSKTGKTEYKKAYEDCYEIGFFEISAVFDPADETALLREIRAHTAAEHTAEAPPPQVDELKMPEGVDTLREETVCPVCGSDIDSETCSVCGYTKPPDGFDNPDLTKANPELTQEGQDEGEDQKGEAAADETFGPNTEDTPPQPSDTSKPPMTSHVTSDMSWTVSTRTAYTQPSKETPAVPNAKPATDEPSNATVKQDHTKPVTSNVKTAGDFLANVDAQRRTMSQHTAYDAPGAPESATPDKNIDVDGVGGFMDASNEEASKADAQIDVVGVGTTGTSDVAADKTESVDQGSETSKNIEEIPTKTFGDNGTSPVTNGVYPAAGGVTSAWRVEALDNDPYPHEDGGLAGGNTVKGVEPADPVGKADDRVDVLDTVTSPENNSGETKTWSGTDGNGVTKQQDPVTNEVYRGDENVNMSPGTTSSAHIFAAMKLADTEVEMGMTAPAEKYERAAELEKLSPEELTAESRVVSRVKTAGLAKPASQAMRMPAMARKASVEKEAGTGVSEFAHDSALFLPN
jgi:hypothetical protein